MHDRNWSRGLLALQALLVGCGGVAVWILPEEACARMAELRALLPDRVTCPRYVGEHPVFEMYNFSLGKHHTMLGLLFGYFATFGRSRVAIDLGFVYFAVAMSLDVVPVLTWLDSSSSPGWPPIARAGVLFLILAGVGIYWNRNAREWRGSVSG